MSTTNTELDVVKFINSISIAGLSTNQLRAGNTQVKSLTLLDGFVRIKTGKATVLVPLANVAYVVPAETVKVEAKK